MPMPRRRPPGLLAATFLGLAACAPTDYFLLPPAAPATGGRAASPSVSVADISLPAYADALEIATLQPSGEVSLAKNALWADTPRRALTRRLVAALQARLSGQVGTEPWPGFEGAGLRVSVIVDRMIGAPGAPLDFAGQYFIVTASGDVLAADRFALTVPSRGPGYAGLMQDHSRAIDLLADQIAARISGRRAPAS